MKCPYCDHDMDADLEQEGICDACGGEFDPEEVKEASTCSECDEEADPVDGTQSNREALRF